MGLRGRSGIKRAKWDYEGLVGLREGSGIKMARSGIKWGKWDYEGLKWD